jgi:hypothetical protein
VPEAEFEPKPKSAGATPEKPGETGLRTAWSPSPPRTPEEPEGKPPKGKK